MSRVSPLFLRPYKQHIFLEILIALLVMVLLLSYAIHEMKLARVKAARLGVFLEFSSMRVSLMESFALNGTWPDQQSMSFERYREPAFQLDAIQGVINLEMRDRRYPTSTSKLLSMRPATSASNTTVLWVCGNAAIPEGVQVSGLNVSALSRDELYVACR